MMCIALMGLLVRTDREKKFLLNGSKHVLIYESSRGKRFKAHTFRNNSQVAQMENIAVPPLGQVTLDEWKLERPLEAQPTISSVIHDEPSSLLIRAIGYWHTHADVHHHRNYPTMVIFIIYETLNTYIFKSKLLQFTKCLTCTVSPISQILKEPFSLTQPTHFIPKRAKVRSYLLIS